ncbi:MAG: glucosaminidase domain-containing protein [Bacillota bacterium]|jgi:flagellar protein FlgJ|nr:hypothetical protein [Bacillota bacterium]
MEPRDFVRLLKPHADMVHQRTGIPVEVMLAQAALETGWLTRTVKDRVTGRDSLNLFNIKGEGPAGSVTASVVEYVKGRKVWQDARFRAYNSYEESFEDYASLIAEAPRYAPAMAVRDNPVAFAWQLQSSGYATDPNYAKKLVAVMQQNIRPYLEAEDEEDKEEEEEEEEEEQAENAAPPEEPRSTGQEPAV